MVSTDFNKLPSLNVDQTAEPKEKIGQWPTTLHRIASHPLAMGQAIRYIHTYRYVGLLNLATLVISVVVELGRCAR
jgi:hypothetical protein